MCKAEIAVYQNRSENVEFVDVSDANLVAPIDLSQDDAMKRFHVRRNDGTLLDGGDAFVELWSQTPGFKFLGTLFRLPGFKRLVNITYDGFLYTRPTLQIVFRLLRGKR